MRALLTGQRDMSQLNNTLMVCLYEHLHCVFQLLWLSIKLCLLIT